jgi:hypothetical protein
MSFLFKILIVFALILLGSPASQAQNDEEAIKAVIEQETAAFMNVDYKTWSAHWLRAPYVFWSYSDSTGTSFIKGWENLDKTYVEYFQNAKPAKAEIINEWLEIRIYQNGAYAHFIQKVVDEWDQDETSQIRILEKTDGKWKVVCVGAIAVYPL